MEPLQKVHKIFIIACVIVTVLTIAIAIYRWPDSKENIYLIPLSIVVITAVIIYEIKTEKKFFGKKDSWILFKKEDTEDGFIKESYYDKTEEDLQQWERKTVNISYNPSSNIEFKNKLTIFLLNYCIYGTTAENFRTINIVIKDELKDTGYLASKYFHVAGYAILKDAASINIEINANVFLHRYKRGEFRYLSHELKKLTEHEYTHCLHNSTASYFFDEQSRENRLYSFMQQIYINTEFEKAVNNNITDNVKEKIFGIVDVRKLLSKFVSMLESEGLAKLYEMRIVKEVKYTRRYLLENYTYTIKYIKYLNDTFHSTMEYYTDYIEQTLNGKTFENKIDRDKLIKDFKSISYKIGFHMVYVITYVDPKIPIKTIGNMEYSQFIRKYEESMNTLGLKPIITLNSGKGYFDYNAFISIWYSLLENIGKFKRDY